MVSKECKLLLRFFLPIVLLMVFGQADAQKLLPDTFFVDLKADTLISLNKLSFSAIEDMRNEDPRFIRYSSKRKFILIPVDQEVYLRENLSVEIGKTLPLDSTRANIYVLNIDKFIIEKQARRFSNSAVLVADIPVYIKQSDSLIYKGTLYYDYQYIPEGKRESLTVSTENLLEKWHREFKIDLLSLRARTGNKIIVQNFIAGEKVKSLSLSSRTDVLAGYNWWGLQGELCFTRPETDERTRNTGSLIRYINNVDYESFAFGKKSEHSFFRRNKNMALDVDLNILLGLCKWKDVAAEAPTLYQIFDFQVSSIQSLMFNPVNSKGMIFRVGIIENFSYVIGKKPKFLVGGVLGIGVKF